MESLMSDKLVPTVLLLILTVLLMKVSTPALRFKSRPDLTQKSGVYNFDYTESHLLLMEREDIVQMTNQGYYDPMDQVFSLERWKQKVAHYMQNYESYTIDNK